MTMARLIVSAALSIALVFIATSSLSIYIPATRGYFNLGDSMIFLTALLFGPFVGCIAGGIGSMLSDVFLGYVVYAPATLVVKGLEGFLTGFLYSGITGKKSRKVWLITLFSSISILIVGSIVAINVFAGEAEISLFATGSASMSSQLLVFTILMVLAVSLILILRSHEKNLPVILPCFIGGFVMVLGYFLYELFLVKLGALLEVPANFAQAFLGTLIASSVYSAIGRRMGTGAQPKALQSSS